jgi:hypothetical protein
LKDKITYFEFNKVADLTVNTKCHKAMEHFSEEYHHHQISSINPYLAQVIYNFKELKSPFYFPRKDYSLHIHKLFSIGWYRLNISENRIEIDVIGNSMEIAMSQHMLVHPSLRYMSSMHDTLMLHAGAISNNGKSLIFTGKGGMGKTTTTSLLLSYNNSWKIHADDYIFLTPEPKSFCYLTNSHLYDKLIYWIPELYKRLSRKEQKKLWLFGKVRKYSGGTIRLPVRVKPEILWPQHGIEKVALPSAIFLLERNENEELSIKKITDYPHAIDQLMEMNFGEVQHFLKLIKRNHSINDFNEWLQQWKFRERGILEQIVKKVPIYNLYLPKSATNPKVLSKDLSALVSSFTE